MIQSLSSFRVANSLLCLASWDTYNLKSILSDFGMRSWSSLDMLRCFVFCQMQWWYVTCLVQLLFNISATLSCINEVWCFMKASARDLGGCLFLVDPCETDGSKHVRLMAPVGTVMVFIIFKISIYFSCSPFYPYSRRCWQVRIEYVTISVDYQLKVEFIQIYALTGRCQCFVLLSDLYHAIWFIVGRFWMLVYVLFASAVSIMVSGGSSIVVCYYFRTL